MDKRRRSDMLTLDLFDVPPSPAMEPGSLDSNARIASAMAEAIRGCSHDRHEIAARMSRLTGYEVTRTMLDAYTSEAHAQHNISLARAIAFDAATEGYSLLNLYARARGCSVMVGTDALLAEMGRADQEIAKQMALKKQIKLALGGVK